MVLGTQPTPPSARAMCRPLLCRCAFVASAIANKGRIMKPHLVKGGPRPEGTPRQEFGPTVLHTLNVPQQHIDSIRRAMRETSSATAARASGELQGGHRRRQDRLPRKRAHKKPHAWFVWLCAGREPSDSPYASSRAAGHGGKRVRPIARGHARGLVQGFLATETEAEDGGGRHDLKKMEVRGW